MWLYGGLLTDEWKSSDTFSQRNETDQRSVQTNNANIQGAYTTVQQARGFIRTAIDLLNKYTPDSTRNIGQMYMALGFSELTIAENFCNGVPETYTNNGVYVYGPQLTTDSVFKRAAFFFDSALARSSGSDALSVAQKQALLVMRARVLVDQGQFANAAALVPVSAVPTNFQYLLTFDQIDRRQPDLEPQHQRGPLHGRRQRRRHGRGEECVAVRLVGRSARGGGEHEESGLRRDDGAVQPGCIRRSAPTPFRWSPASTHG